MADKSANKPKKGAHLIKKQAPKPEKPAQAVRTEAKQPKKKRRVPIGVKIAVGVVIAAAAGAFGYVYCYPNVFPGVTVGPITVGGMNRDDAANTIEDQSAPLYEGKNVTVTIYDSNYDIPVDKVLKSVDGIQSAENAYEIGRTGNPLERVHDIIGAMRGHREAQIAATVDEESLRGTLNEIADTALTEPVNPTWELKDSNLIVHSGKPGVKFDTDAVEQALTDQIRLMDFEPYEVSTDVTAAPAIDVDKIAADIIGDPVNATVSKKDGKTIGYCAVSSAKGYGGNVAVTMGVDMDGKIVGCQIGDTNFAETDGFGARWKEPARAEAFIGLSAFGGDTIEAITGATVTSKAVLAASNDVLKCISHVLGKDVEGDVLAFGVKEEKPAQTVELTGDVHQGKAVGFGNGEVTARLTLNDDGTIAALVIDASTQTPGFGTRCADEEFTAQFIGKSGPFTLNENVDGLTGATITSTAAVEAINAALTSPAMAAEDLEPVATEAPAATEEPTVLENAKTATIAGFGGADITVQVTDENGVITALVVDASSQTAGLGQKCADEAFTSQFIGKSAPLTLGVDIDAVTGATLTSQAVVDAVNQLAK